MTRVLVIPFFRRYWLLHAWSEATPSAAVTASTPGGANGGSSSSSTAKLQQLVGSLQAWGQRRVEQQWTKLAAAPAGSMNGRLHALAQAVQSRVDPNESFLKALQQQQGGALSFTYPASLPETLVRRRLRLLAAKAQPFHASRLRLWLLAVIPQVPLIPLPLPNVTLYFTAWRVYSNSAAGKGASALCASMDLLSDVQRLHLAQQLQQLQQQQGVTLHPGSWAEALVAEAGTLQRRVQAAGHDSQAAADGHEAGQQQGQQQQQQRQGKRVPLPVFIPDAELDALVQPHARLAAPLPESAAEALAALYSQPHLLEHDRAARKKCEQTQGEAVM